MRVAMIGTGYVGLVSGACFADFGHEVTCVDKDTGKIAALGRGEVPIYEPGLNDLVAANTRAGRLKFTNDLPGAVKVAVHRLRRRRCRGGTRRRRRCLSSRTPSVAPSSGCCMRPA